MRRSTARRIGVPAALLFALVAPGTAFPDADDVAHLGVFADSQATRACATLAHGEQTTLYVIATLDGPLLEGIWGAEFRVEIADPNGWFLTYTPPRDAIYIGNPVDRDGAVCTGAGVTVAFPECRAADVAPGKVLLGTLVVTNVGGLPTQLVVKRHISPPNPRFRCPLLVQCNAPQFDVHCVQPMLREACDNDGVLAAGPPGRDAAFFVTALNAPLDARAFAAPQRHPERELIVGVAPSVLRFPADGSTTTLEAADVPSAQLLRTLESARVAGVGAAFPDCAVSECVSEADVRWCDSVAEIAMLRFNHARTARRALKALRGSDGVRFVAPAAVYLVPRETSFVMHSSAQEGMQITADTRLTVTLSKPAWLVVELLDASGRTAATVWEAFVAAGEHEIPWANVTAPSGLYTLRVGAGGAVATYKVVMSGA